MLPGMGGFLPTRWLPARWKIRVGLQRYARMAVAGEIYLYCSFFSDCNENDGFAFFRTLQAG